MKEQARAFDNVTDTPCPRCMKLAWDGEIPTDFVMPMPKEPFVPISREPGGQKCCHDCAAADGLLAMASHMTFAMARIAIGNDRREGLRMPLGMMEHFGTCKMGLTKPASQEDLTAYYGFLTRNHLWPRKEASG